MTKENKKYIFDFSILNPIITKKVISMEKKKVLHILNEIKQSGAETMLECAAEEWKSSGFDLYVLSTGPILGSYAQNLEKVGYTCFHIPFNKLFLVPTISFMLKLFFLLKNNHFDVVHIHPERGNFTYACIAFFAGTKAIIRTVHHIFPLPKTMFWRGIRVIRIVQRFVIQKILKVVITSNSPSGLQNEKTEYFIENQLIPNWYNSNKYKLAYKSKSKKIFGCNESQMIFVSLGGNWPYKNYKAIVESFGLIDNDAKYFIIGPDSNSEINSYIKLKGLGGKVKHLGIVDDPLEYLSAADVYIMASTEEGFGIAAVEAMAVGLPMVLSNAKALCDFQQVTNDIEWCDTNPDSIAKSINTILTYSENDLENKSFALSEVAKNNYSIEKVVSQFSRLYKGN